MKIVGDTHLAWSRHSRLRTEHWYLAWDRYNLSVSIKEANWALKLDMNFYSTLQTWPKTCLVKRATMLVQNPPKQQKIESINFHVKAHSPPLFLSFIFLNHFVTYFCPHKFFCIKWSPTGADTHRFPPFYWNRSDFFLKIIYIFSNKWTFQVETWNWWFGQMFSFSNSGHSMPPQWIRNPGKGT